MGLPKLVLGIIFSAIGIISFTTVPGVTAGHTPLADLLPFITATPSHEEVAQLIPTKNPSATEVVKVLGFKTTPTPSSHETSVPTAVPTSIPPTHINPTSIPVQPTVIPTVVQNQSDDAISFIMQAINDYRHSNGLGSVVTNNYTCSFAATRAQEIASNFSHDGFSSRLSSHTFPYPNYSLVTENIAQTSNYKDVVNLWANSPGHAANMKADTPYICVAQHNDYYAMEGWKPQ